MKKLNNYKYVFTPNNIPENIDELLIKNKNK